MRVLVAGIGGASLGTEVLKCLRAAGRYRVFGCDISPLAYGHYQGAADETFVVPRDGYAEAVLELCRAHAVEALVPGGEEPLALLSARADELAAAGVFLAANSAEVVAECSDKARLFERLGRLGLPVPWTRSVTSLEQLGPPADLPCPLVVKPATGSGGSRFVFLLDDPADAPIYVKYLLAQRPIVLVQEYVPEGEGEFTVGVLHRPDGRLVGSVALRRLFHSQLSVLTRSDAGLISTGYSQGLIDDFPAVRAQAERVAAALGSVGPLNVQGRVRDGTLLPFEVNPRFSASTYLRALAGFNEVDLYLRCRDDAGRSHRPSVRPGYYLRSLTETWVDPAAVER
ncbi:MAG TPA: ATP-grasp domain-containing protein [Chloroflexota bacterium]